MTIAYHRGTWWLLIDGQPWATTQDADMAFKLQCAISTLNKRRKSHGY